MGCNCGKKRVGNPVVPADAPAPTAKIVYDVHDSSGSLVASADTMSYARSQARAVGGTVVPRKTSA